MVAKYYETIVQQYQFSGDKTKHDTFIRTPKYPIQSNDDPIFLQYPRTCSLKRSWQRGTPLAWPRKKKKRKKLENRHSFLPDCIRSTMSSCRWWDAIVGEYIYIYMLHPHNPHFQGWNTIFRINDGTIHKIGKYVVASADTRRKLNGRVWASVVVVEHARGVIAQKWSAPVFERRVSV